MQEFLAVQTDYGYSEKRKPIAGNNRSEKRKAAGALAETAGFSEFCKTENH